MDKLSVVSMVLCSKGKLNSVATPHVAGCMDESVSGYEIAAMNEGLNGW